MSNISDRIYLDVPFADKESAKSLGARFDGDARRWYWPGSSLPSGLKQHAPADGAISERQIEGQIADRVAAIVRDMPAALDHMRREITQRADENKPSDPAADPYASIELMLAQQDDDILADAIEILTRSAQCDQAALQNLLDGNRSGSASGIQATAAFRASLGGGLDARTRLADIKLMSAKALVATAWRQRVRVAVEQHRRATDGLLRAQREAILDAIASEINPHAAVRAWHDDKPYTVKTVTGVHVIEIGIVNDTPVIWSVDGQEVARDWRIYTGNPSLTAISAALKQALTDQGMQRYLHSMMRPAK